MTAMTTEAGTINIAGINKALLLAALYNRARPLGLGYLHYTPEDMDPAEAEALVEREWLYHDYLHGRVMKVDLSGDTLRTWAYNRDNGDGAAEAVVASLKKEGN